MAQLALSILLAGALGCSATVQTTPLEKLDIGTKYEGVIAFYPKLVTRSFLFTKLKVDGKTGGKCEAVPGTETVVVPNFAQPMLIGQSAQWFAATKHSVVLEGGMLKSVNLDSDPQIDETITAATELLTKLAPAVALLDFDPDLPDCNAGKRYVPPTSPPAGG